MSNSGDYIFRNVPSDIYEGVLMANFSFDSLKFKKIAILFSNTEYGIGVKNSFTNQFSKLGGLIIQESFSDGTNDFRTQLTKIKLQNPDAIYFIGYMELGNMIKQAHDLGIKSQYLTTAIFEDESILNFTAGAAENLIFTSITFDVTNPNERAKNLLMIIKQNLTNYLMGMQQ
ncbi:MAG: ABC transporter substrate-binding protein [Bacteroidales bacterium]|nr:ABC transporter substrate-binding protein [Bacteroidales bacterium]